MIRCKECNNGALKLALFLKKREGRGSDRGILKCDNCEHEVKFL